MYTGYFDNMMCVTKSKKISSSSQSFQYWYRYIKDLLYAKAIGLFEWDTQGEIPEKEIEKILIMNGKVCVTDKYKGSKGRLGAFFGEYAGQPTIYYDIYKSFAFNSPIDARILDINKNCIVGLNNSLKLSTEPLIHAYAVVLAHTKVTIINKLINGREKYVAVAGNKTAMAAWNEYRTNLVTGALKPLSDPALMSVDVKTFPGSEGVSLAELQEFYVNTYEMFLNMIGIKTSHDKKGNMIKEEVAANDSMLIFNIHDMYDCREELCDNVNKLYGRNWSFKKCECIDYEAAEAEMMKGGVVNEESDTE